MKEYIRSSFLGRVIVKRLITIRQREFEKLGRVYRKSLNEEMAGTIYTDEVDGPFVFSSVVCKESHFRLPLYAYWCNALRKKPRFHRKQWEYVYISQVLHERGKLTKGASGIGFGVGREPLVSLFASRGVKILATDLNLEEAKEKGWVQTSQHSNEAQDLNLLGLCDPTTFKSLVEFMHVDMNDIPKDIGVFDFCWSSCALEHLGSINKGKEFIFNSVRLLKPGGVAVHTTELNLSSPDTTLDNDRSCVIFRRKDIENIADELRKGGYKVEFLDFSPGNEPYDNWIDAPPYQDNPHLKLKLGQIVTTSIGFIVKAPEA